ncbi:MAG: hypothetical protein RL151_1310 [Bacteroidota bacterium]
MNKTLSLALQYLIFLGLGLFLIWWSIHNLTDEDMRRLGDALGGADYILVLPAMLILLLSHYSRALRWRILMKPLGFEPSRLNTFFAVMLGYFFNLLVPRMGEVMKCTMLAKYEHTPVDKLIGTMVAERALDVICLALVIGLSLVLQMDMVNTFLSGTDVRVGTEGFGWWRLIGALLLVVAGIWVIRLLMMRYAHVNIVSRIRTIATGIWQGLTSIRRIESSRLPAFLFHTIFIWAMYLLSIRMGFYAMSSVMGLGMSAALTILSVGSLAMIITQGGIGAYQIVVQRSLALYGIPEVSGLAFGWLLWAVQTILVLVVGLICLILLPVINKRKKS